MRDTGISDILPRIERFTETLIAATELAYTKNCFEAEMHAYRLEQFYRANPKGLAVLLIKEPLSIVNDRIDDRGNDKPETTGRRTEPLSTACPSVSAD